MGFYDEFKQICEQKVCSILSKIESSIKTEIPNGYQAGQWSFPPSELPISALTAKLAADEIKKKI